MEPENSPVGKIGDISLPFFTRVGSTKGVLSAFLIGYLDYLTRTHPPDYVRFIPSNDRELPFFRCHYPDMAADVSKALKTSVTGPLVERRLTELLHLKLLRRAMVYEGGATRATDYYAVNYEALEPYLLGD